MMRMSCCNITKKVTLLLIIAVTVTIPITVTTQSSEALKNTTNVDTIQQPLHHHSIGMERSSAVVRYNGKTQLDYPIVKPEPEVTIEKIVDVSLLEEMKILAQSEGEMMLLIYFKNESAKQRFASFYQNRIMNSFSDYIKVNGSKKDFLDINSAISLDKIAKINGVRNIQPVISLRLINLISNNSTQRMVFIHYQGNLDKTELQTLASFGVISIHEYSPLGYARALVPENKITEIAKLPFVIRINDAEGGTTKTLNNAAPMTSVDEVKDWWVNEGYTGELGGSGIRVAVVDWGYDEDNPYLKLPIERRHYVWPESYDNDTTDNDGHGTHVTGVIVSNHSEYYGVAPDVDLIVLKPEECGRPGGCAVYIDDAIREAVDEFDANVISVSIHPDFDTTNTNLYGTDEWDRAIDYATRQGAIVFVAAGNSENQVNESYVLEKLADAKNAITVGATSHWGEKSELANYDRDKVTTYSSPGDTLDGLGRDKPEIVAPGGEYGENGNCTSYKYGMISTKSSDANYSAANYYAGPECEVGDYFIKLKGTSMAAPVAAGIAALYLQAYPELFNNSDSRAALMKARLMVSAVDVDSFYDSDEGYWHDYKGFGKVDLHNGFLSTGHKVIDCWNSTVGKNEVDEWGIYIADNIKTLKIVLAWSDPDSSTTDGNWGSLKNDIDLYVSSPNGNYTTESISFQNPVEFVTIENPDSGWWEVNVTGYDHFEDTDQTYGLCLMTIPQLGEDTLETNVYASKTWVAPNDYVDITAVVENKGATTASGVELNLTFDESNFELVDGTTNPLLGNIGGYFEIRNYTWTLKAKSGASAGEYYFQVYARDSTESITSNNVDYVDVLRFDFELTPWLEYQSYNLSTSTNYSITARINNTGSVNASNVNATISIPGGLSTSDDLTQTISLIEPGEEEEAVWSVSADNEEVYSFTVDVNAVYSNQSYAKTLYGCLAVSNEGNKFCEMLYLSWNLISLPLES